MPTTAKTPKPEARTSESSPRIVRKHNKRREGILKAAAVVFAEMGYHRSSLEDIADRLDLTRASLYHYFPGKDALLAECLEFGAAEAISELERVAEETRDEPSDVRLRQLIRTQLLVITRDAPELSRLFVSTMDWPEGFRSQVRRLRERHDAYFRAVITAGVEDGTLQCANPEIARHCLHGAINYVPVWLRPKAGTAAYNASVNELVDTVMELFKPKSS